MSVILSAVKTMLSAGMSADIILQAIAEMEAVETEQTKNILNIVDDRRKRDRERKAGKRAKASAERPQRVRGMSADKVRTKPLPPAPLALSPDPLPTPPIPPSPEKLALPSGYPPKFEEFWRVFPKKREKPNAFAAWKVATKKAPAEEIIKSAAAYSTSRQAIEGFCPYPAKWLKQERWTEDNEQGDIFNGISKTGLHEGNQTRRNGRKSDADITAEAAERVILDLTGESVTFRR